MLSAATPTKAIPFCDTDLLDNEDNRKRKQVSSAPAGTTVEASD